MFLPAGGSKARRLAVFLLFLAPLLTGCLALYLGQDTNWDLRNYHWYNAYALLSGRIGFDVVPSQTPAFYNPALDVPFFLLASFLSAKTASFILAAVQGLNFVLLFMLAHATLRIPQAKTKVWACAGIAALGLLGGGGIAQIGTTFYDNITSLGLFGSALLVLRFWPRLNSEAWNKALILAALCGFPAGLMMGLKLPAALFCVGLCGAFLFLTGPLARRFWIAFGFGLGVLAGLAVSLGPWAVFLGTHYGNPLFPYFNDFFASPYAPPVSARDMKFIPTSWYDRLFFPFIFAKSPYRVGEIPWQDFRLPLLYVLLPAALFLRLLFARNKNAPDRFADYVPARYLLWFAVISYLVWLFFFAIYRYALPLEMIAPLLIVLAIGLLPLPTGPRTLLAFFALLAVALSIQPGNWGRREVWLDKAVEAQIPAIEHPADTMILMAGFEPYSHLVPLFPPEIPFVRIQSNFTGPEKESGFNALIRKRIFEHQGSYKILIQPYLIDVAQSALSSFGLTFRTEGCQLVQDFLFNTNLKLCDVTRSQPVKK